MAYFINYGGMENAFLAEENRQRQLQNLIQNFPNFNVNPELSDPAKQLGFQTEEEYQEYVRQQAEQKRQAQLEEERQRARQRELEYLNQYDPDKENIERRRNFLSLPDEKKVELLRAGKVNDAQYLQDIDNKSYAELEMEYGTPTAEYARNKHLEQLQRTNTLLAQQPEYSKGGYWEDVRGFGSGITQTLHGFADDFEIRKIKNDDSLTSLEKEQRLREHEQKIIARTSASNEWVGSRYEDSYQLNLILRDLYDEKYAEEYQRAYAKTGDEKTAKQIASREANQVYKDADTLTREFFIQGSGNQVPQLLVAAITAPIGGYILGTAGKVASPLIARISANPLTKKAFQLSRNNFKNQEWIKSTFRMADKEAVLARRRLSKILQKSNGKVDDAFIANMGVMEAQLAKEDLKLLLKQMAIHNPQAMERKIRSLVNTYQNRISSVGQLVGGSVSASYAFGKQSEMGAYSQTVLRGLDEFRKLEPEKQKEMLSSPQMQGFRESYIELTGNENPSDEEIVAYALDTAGQKAGDRAFDTTFWTSMVSMPFFQMIWRPSSLGNIAPTSARGKLGLLAGDAGIQGWQEKNQEMTEGLAPREEANIATGYELYPDTMRYGLETTSNQGALLATVFTGASGGLKTGYNLAKGVFESNFTEEGKIRKNIRNIEKRLQKQEKERNIKIENINNDLNNLNNDTKFNTQLDEIKTQINELLNNKNQKTISSKGQTLQAVYDLVDNINTRLEQLDNLSDVEKQEQKNIDEKNNLIDTLGYISLSLEKLINSTVEDSQNILQTLNDNKKRLSEIDQITNTLNNIIPQLKNDFDNNVITEDAYNATLNDINTQLNDLNEEKNNLTTLNKELSDKILNISNFGHTDTFNQLVQTKDKLDQQQIVAKNINISDIPFANIPIVSYSSSNVISKIQNSTSEEEANNIILGWFKGFRQSVNKKLSNINGKFNVSDVDNFYNDLTKIQQELNNKGYSNVLLDSITATIKTLQDTINSSPKALLKINNNGDIADDSTVMVILSKLLLGINEIAGEKRNLPSVLEIAHQMLSFKERTKGSYNAFRLLTTQRAKLDAIQNIINNPSSYTEGSKIAVGTNPDGSPIYLMKKGKKQGSKNNDDYVNFTSTVGKNGIKKEWTEYAENFLSLLEIEAQLIEDLLSNILSLREQVFQAKYINKPQGGNQGGNQGGTPPVSNTPPITSAPQGGTPPSPSSSGSNTQGNQTQGNNTQPINNTQLQPQPKKVSKKTQPKTKVDVKKQQQQRRIKAFEDKVIKAQDEKTRTKNWKILTADRELAQLNPPRKVSSDYQSGQGFIEYTIEFKQERPVNGDSIEAKLRDKFGEKLQIEWKQPQKQQQNQTTSSTSIPRHMRSSLFDGKHKFANVAEIRKEILRIIDEKDEQAWNELLDYLENDTSSTAIDKETIAKLREMGIPTELFFDDDSSKAINNQGTLTGGIELNYDSKNLNNTEKRNIQIFFNRLLNADYAINNPDIKNIMVMFKPKNQNTSQQQTTSSNTGSKKKIIKNIRKPNNKVINSEKDKVENIQDRDFVIRDFGQLKEDWVKERLDSGKTNEEIIQEIYDNFNLNRYTPKQLEYLDEHLENELVRIKKELNYQDNQNKVEENNQTQEVVEEQTPTEPEKSDREKLINSYIDSTYVGKAFETPRRLLKESLYHNENSQKSWEDLFKGVPDKNNKIAKQTLLGLGVPENITRKDGVLTLTFNKDPKEIKTSNKNINQKQAERLLEQLLNEPVKIEVVKKVENKVENKPTEKTKPVQQELPFDTGSKQTTEKQPQTQTKSTEDKIGEKQQEFKDILSKIKSLDKVFLQDQYYSLVRQIDDGDIIQEQYLKGLENLVGKAQDLLDKEQSSNAGSEKTTQKIETENTNTEPTNKEVDDTVSIKKEITLDDVKNLNLDENLKKQIISLVNDGKDYNEILDILIQQELKNSKNKINNEDIIEQEYIEILNEFFSILDENSNDNLDYNEIYTKVLDKVFTEEDLEVLSEKNIEIIDVKDAPNILSRPVSINAFKDIKLIKDTEEHIQERAVDALEALFDNKVIDLLDEGQHIKKEHYNLKLRSLVNYGIVEISPITEKDGDNVKTVGYKIDKIHSDMIVKNSDGSINKRATLLNMQNNEQLSKTMFGNGYNIATGKITENVGSFGDNIDIKLLIKSLDSFITNNDNIENIKNILKSLDKNISETTLTNLVNKDNIEKTKEYINLYIEIFKNVDDFLHNNNNIVLSSEPISDNYAGLSDFLDSFNSFVQLGRVYKNSKTNTKTVMFDASIIAGFSLSFINYIDNVSSRGNSSDSSFRDWINEAYGSDVELSIDITTADVASNKNIEKIKERSSITNPEDLSILGENKENAVVSAGNTLLKKLGIKFTTNNLEEDIKQSFINGLGLEFLNFLQARKLLNTFNLNIQKNDGEIVIVPYVNSVLNINDNIPNAKTVDSTEKDGGKKLNRSIYLLQRISKAKTNNSNSSIIYVSDVFATPSKSTSGIINIDNQKAISTNTNAGDITNLKVFVKTNKRTVKQKIVLVNPTFKDIEDYINYVSSEIIEIKTKTKNKDGKEVVKKEEKVKDVYVLNNNVEILAENNVNALWFYVENFDNDFNALVSSSLKVSNLKDSEIHKVLFNEELNENKKYIPVKDDENSLEVARSNGLKSASAKDVSDKLFSNQINKEVEENINNHNQTKFKLDTEMVKLIETSDGLEIIERLNNYTDTTIDDDIPKDKHIDLNYTQKYKESVKSRNNSIDRSIEEAQNLIKQARDISGSDDVSNVSFYINHKFTENQRTMQEASENPQSNKIIREILKVQSNELNDTQIEKIISDIDQKIGLESTTYNEDELRAILKNSAGTITVGDFDAINTSKDKKTSKNNARSLENLIDEVIAYPEKIKELERNNVEKEEIQKLRQDYFNKHNFILALAQALGVKVEKSLTSNIYTELKEKYDKNKQFFDDITYDIFRIITAKNKKVKSNNLELYTQLNLMFDTSYKGAKNGTMRAFSALKALSMYMYSEPQSNIKINLYIEADGLSNFMSNLIRQFGTVMSSNYFRIQEKIGSGSITTILEILKNKNIILDKEMLRKSLTSQEINDLLKSLEGTAGIYSGRNIEDIYQTLSSQITKEFKNDLLSLQHEEIYTQIQKYLTNILGEIDDIKLYHLLDSKFLETLKNNTDRENRSGYNKVANVAGILQKITKMFIIDGTISQTEEAKQNNRLMDLDYFMNTLLETSLNNLDTLTNSPMFDLVISRNFSKIILTPAGYGGGQEGINNQFFIDYQKGMYYFVDNLYKGLTCLSDLNNIEKLKKIIKDYNTDIKELVKLKKSLNKNDKDYNEKFNEYSAKISQLENDLYIYTFSLNNLKQFLVHNNIIKNISDFDIKNADIYLEKTLNILDVNSKYLELFAQLNDIEVSNLNNQIVQIKDTFNLDDIANVKKDLNAISNVFFNNKEIISSTLKAELGKYFNDVIKERTYKDIFNTTQKTISFDEVSVDIFTLELDKQIRGAIEKRNEKYAENDPRRHSLLSQKEINKIMKNILALPSIAGAFGHNVKLLESLIEEGHSIISVEKVKSSNIPPQFGAGSFFTKLGGKNPDKVSIFTANINFKLKKYFAGGATNLTNTLVSTESMVQAIISKICNELGLGVLNVYDGIDALYALAPLFSILANDAYNKIHQQTNLLEQFFHRLNRSNIISYIYSDAQLKNLFNKYQEDYTIKLSREDIVFLKSLMYIINSSELDKIHADILSIMKISDFSLFQNKENTINFKSLQKFLSDVSKDLILSGVDYMYVENKDLYILLETLSNLDGFHKHISELYTILLQDFRNNAVEAYAREKIEDKHLTYIFNQYAGSGRGIISNVEQLFKDSGTLQRFLEFSEKHRDDFIEIDNNDNEIYFHDADIYQKLEYFINNDFDDKNNSITRDLDEFRREKINELVLNTENVSISEDIVKSSFESSKTKLTDKKVSLNKFVSYIYNEHFHNREFDNNNFLQNTTRVILINAGRLLEGLNQDINLYINKEEFLSACKKANINNVKIDETTDGLYVKGVGIYIDVSVGKDTLKALTHELVHYIFDSFLSLYYGYSDKNLQKKLEDEYKSFTDPTKKNNINLIIKDFKNIAFNLEQEAIKFAKSFAFDPRVIKFLNDLSFISDKNGYINDNLFIADQSDETTIMAKLASAILFAFNDKEGREYVSPEIKQKVLSEFLAYALSERSILNRLAYTKENDIVRKFEKREKETAKELAKKGIKSEYKTNPFIYLKEIAQKAKLLIDSIKKSLGKLFFGKSYDYKDREQNEIFNSSLFNILGSMQITVSKKLAIKNNIDKHFVIPDNQPIIFYSQSSNKSSIQHQKYLDNLFNSFKENVRYNDKINNNEIAENIFNRKVEIADKENTIVKLRNTGIPISFQEEYMYSLMSSVYNLAFKNENPTLKRLSTQLIHKLINKLNTVNNLTEEQLNLIFRNSVKYNNTFDLANTLSLLTTVEPIKNIFNKLLEEEKIDDYNKNIFYQISTKMREPANKDLLEDISYKAIKLDIAKSIDYNRQQEIQLENYNEVLIKRNFANNVIEKLDNSKIPEKFQYILASGIEEIVLGSLANNSFKYSDGVFGEWLQNFTNKLAIKNGNFLGFFGNIFRWIFQARLNTVDIYDRRNKAAAQIERIRQNYITVIPEYLKSLFKPNTFNEEVDKVIYNNVLKPRLHNIYNNITGSNSEKLNFLKEYITNENSRKERIKEIYSELEDNVEQVFNMLQDYNIHFNKQVIINYLKWQSMGLAQLMITGSANRLSKQSLISNDILPNSKAIASLNDLIVKTASYNLYKSLKNNMQIKKDIEYDIETLTLPELYEDRINLLKPLVDELVSLHSLRLLDKNELNILADNIEKNPKALTVIFNTLSDIDTKYSENAPASLLGYDGYIHSSNIYNNIDIRLVNSDEEKQIKNLEKLDYYKYQEITTGDDISFYVMVSHNYIGERFQTGILNLTEQTVNGASVKTRNKLNSIQTYYDYVERLNEKLPNTNFLKLYSKDAQNALQEYDKSFDNFMEEKKDYFDSCINLNISEDGIPVYTFINLPDKIKERINPTQQKSLDSLGKLNGRIFEEYIVNKNNIKNIQALNELYDQDYKHRNQYFYVSVEKTKKGNYKVFIDLPNDTNKEKQYLRKIKNLIKSLPKDSLDYIIEKGLWLNRIEIDNILGYNHITVLDLYSLKEKLPNEVKKGLIAFSNIFSNNKFKNFLYKGEKFIQEQVSTAKDFILNRSIKVSLSNMLSNILHLTSLGISPEFIQTYGKEGLLNSIQYQKDYGDLQKITFQLSVENLNDKEKNILEIKQQFLIKSLRDNPIRALIKAGIFSNISTEIYFENTLINSKQEEISVLEEMIDKTPLKGEPKQMYKNIMNNKIVSNILINKQSSMHNFMENVLNYGDFISKYILLRHLIDKKGFSIQNAMNVIREEFVNYSMNRGAVFDYLNSMGLTWFLSYFTGIQKVIWRRMRTNFLGMLSVYSAGKIIDDPFGLIQTVPEQNIFEKNWDYATSPSNIWNSYESHYLNNVWDIIF